ncbi:MAG TPA: hypothetical protein VKY92_25210 [Verrucomicrobiae bacterium]|nr:hypothetical protein [Verrucomicrobiae bacterium]
MRLRRWKWVTALAAAVLAVVGWRLFSGSNAGFKLPTGNVRPAVALGDSHGVILASDGSLWVWGEEEMGWPVLGLGPVHRQPMLRRLGNAKDWVDVAAGNSHTLALKSDGRIWAWGENHGWQLGDGTTTPSPVPVQAVPGNDWKQVATGLHCMALKKDGTLWAWGNNWAGVLGTGTMNNSKTPVQVGTSTNWVKIWANNIESVGLQSDGTLWRWGYCLLRFGATPTNVLSPTRLSADTNWVDVGLGDFMGFAIKSDGTLWAWGADADIYTGAPSPDLNGAPRQVGADHNWAQCAPFWNCCVLLKKTDGSLWALDDVLDQRGARLGNSSWKMKPLVPRRINLDEQILAFAGGRRKLGVALTPDGEVWTWGWAMGQRSPSDRILECVSWLLARTGIQSRPLEPGVVSKPWRLATQEN